MTGLIVLTFVPFIVAAGFLIRVRAEQKALVEAESRLTALQARLERQRQQQQELFALLAHELRSPIAAILGYEELLAEGTFGHLDARARDPIARIRLAAEQLRLLVDGFDQMDSTLQGAGQAEAVSGGDLIDRAIELLRFEAESRSITVYADNRSVDFVTRADDARRAVLLALGAAIKASPGATLRLCAAAGDAPHIRITGTGLDLTQDAPATGAEPGGPRTGAGLRLSFAAAAARRAGGALMLESTAGGVEVRVVLPRLAD
jgi:signal transduction histidine kinase